MEKTEGFKSIGARFWDRHHPGCKDYKYKCDDYWRCYIRHNTLTINHQTTTCKMGSKDDNSTVVDSKLRLFKYYLLLEILILVVSKLHFLFQKDIPIYICLTSVPRAKLKEKWHFPLNFRNGII